VVNTFCLCLYSIGSKKIRASVLRSFFKPGLLIWLAFTFGVFWGLTQLAFWQYDRGIEKDHRVARIEALNKEYPMSLSQVVDLSLVNPFSDKGRLAQEAHINKKDGINDYPVMVNGNFIKEAIFLLDNQVDKGRLGYRVLQIIQTEQYNVLVHLGWVQGSINRNELPIVKPYSGDYSFNGHVRLMEQGIMLMEQDFTDIQWPLRVQQIELDKFSTLLLQEFPNLFPKLSLNRLSEQENLLLLPFVIYVDEAEEIGFKKNWHAIVMPAEKHYGYAFQWGSLAVAWLLLMGGVAGKTYTKIKNRANTKPTSKNTKKHQN
jgi:surfeit locus 1 family protein